MGANGAGAGAGLPAKRKAESYGNDIPAKVQRRDALNKSERMNGSSRPTAVSEATKSKSSSTDPLPYRGTAAGTTPSSNQSKTIPKATPTGTNAPKVANKPVVKAEPGTAIPTPAAMSATTSAATSATPRPGSYAAMLARAKEVQEAKAAVPIVKPQSVEKLTRKERLALQAEAKHKNVSGKDRKLSSNGHSKALEVTHSKLSDPGKDRKKSADLGYQGTMRPKSTTESTYQGTIRHGNSASTPARRPGAAYEGGSSYDRSRSTSLTAKAKPSKEKGTRYAGYASYSDADLEDEYESDASSDMDAGIFDVEKEEREALLVAKKEDEEALKEENELKRQKAERKRTLERMAAAAAKKKRTF